MSINFGIARCWQLKTAEEYKLAIDDVQAFSTVAASNTDIGGANIAELCAPSGINNALRSLGAMLRRAVANQGADKTAAGTTSIAETGTSVYAKITGTTTITSFGTPDGNPIRWIQWGAATPVTHNATSMILKGGVSKTYAAGGISCFVHEGGGNWRELYDSSLAPVGKHKLWIPASAMRPNTILPPASTDNAATDIQYYTLDFDQSNIEIAHFSLSMPSSWNEGTVTAVFVWTAAAGTGDVTWRLNAAARSNDDAIAISYSNTADVTDTLLATGDVHRTAETSALTVEGSPAANDMVFFRVLRFASDGSDTLNADAKLIGVELYITTDAAVDVA
jgi:hypothetical protein